MIVVKAGIRKFMKETEARVSSGFYEALDLAVQENLRKAAERAKANHRRSIMAYDL